MLSALSRSWELYGRAHVLLLESYQLQSGTRSHAIMSDFWCRRACRADVASVEESQQAFLCTHRQAFWALPYFQKSISKFGKFANSAVCLSMLLWPVTAQWTHHTMSAPGGKPHCWNCLFGSPARPARSRGLRIERLYCCSASALSLWEVGIRIQYILTGPFMKKFHTSLCCKHVSRRLASTSFSIYSYFDWYSYFHIEYV